MKMPRNHLLVLTIVAMMSAGCGHQLKAPEADRLVSAHPKAQGLTPITTEAVSSTSDTEAITRTKIVDQILNLKFRRYDNGWRWEFAETKGGGWIAAEEVLGSLQEAARVKRANVWATSHAADYQNTIAAMDRYSESMPRLTSKSLTFTTWNEHRHLLADFSKQILAIDKAIDAERRARLESEIASVDQPAMDAWNHEILLAFDDSKRQATFLSIGPDGKKATADDVLCLVTGRREWDSSRNEAVWEYTKQWLLPEGLQGAIDAAIKQPANRKAEFSKAVE